MVQLVKKQVFEALNLRQYKVIENRTLRTNQMDDYELKLESNLDGHTDRVWCVRWHPNGRYIATCSADRTIRIWSKDGLLMVMPLRRFISLSFSQTLIGDVAPF